MPMTIPPEGQTVEWKRSPGEWKEIVETCAAFAAATGARRIIDDCLAAGLPEPEFETHPDYFRVIFRPKPLEELHAAVLALNERQQQVLDFVKQHGRITTADLQRLSNAPSRTARRDLQQLVKMGILRKRGQTRDACYEPN